MAATQPMLSLLLLLSVVASGKAKPQDANSTLEAEEAPTNETSPSEAPISEAAEVERKERLEPRAGASSSICPCDLHPGFCDLNCCCDSSCGSDCSTGGPECPFSFCLPGSTRAVSQVCLEKSTIFQNNTPYRTDVLPGPGGCVLLFCVELNDPKLNYLQQPQVVTKVNFPALSAQYGGSSFNLPDQVLSSPSAFYRVGDPIQTYFAASSVLSILKQPVGIGTSQLCIDENPAGFLESKNTSCIRILPDLTSSCTTDPALDAASYYRGFSVLKIKEHCKEDKTVRLGSKVNITPVSEPASPSLSGSTCHNVVSEVSYEVEFNGIHGIQKVSVQFKVASISGNPRATLQQRFSLHFGSRSASLTKQRSGNPGYIIGAPLIVLYNGTQQHITILRNQVDGQCSATESVPFKLEEANCSHFQETLYQAFEGAYNLGGLAITGNADPSRPGEWTNIFTQGCKIQDGHCMVPTSLKIQVIWAHIGLLSNPQAQILGARYHYLCKSLKSIGNMVNMLPLTTTVAFTDATKWPEPPRGQPRAYWKLPFDFFFPFKVALSGAGSSSGSLPGTLLVTLTFCKLLVS
ncbi:tectonic-3 isoform X3 [Podarcis raffonei]|uniref:tectonic-3 isoform X3 n=1 Tax=Podarcis raffonei TaxID=65483 RepID=UPI00232942DA|nr:tectonic-3 isoform X3 [Podarcis raffonei]